MSVVVQTDKTVVVHAPSGTVLVAQVLGGGGNTGGGMQASVYDPQNIAADAFARENHTGTQLASTISDFIATASAAAPVQSVSGKTGAVTLGKADVGLSNVDNTSDASKPISTATQAALNAKIPEAPTDGKQYARKDAGWAEVAASGGDMEAATYDPQGIEADAFDRANHTGTQPMESISDKQGKVLDDLIQIEDAADIETTFAVGGYIVKEDDSNGFLAGATMLVSANGGVVSQLISVPLVGKIALRRYEAGVWGDLSFTLAPFDVQIWYGNTTATAANAVITADGTFNRSLFVPAPLAPKITVGLTAEADTDILRPYPLTAATTFPNPTGTPMDGFGFFIELQDNGTARSLTWGSDYTAGFAALPTTTTAGKLGQIAIQYRSGKYRCDGVRWMA